MGLGFLNKNTKKKIMKRILSSFALVASCTFTAYAQIAEGFYHVQNTVTGRYISIEDTNKDNYSVSLGTANVNMAGIRTIKGGERVSSSPSTVIYVRNVGGNKYDLEGQGSSLYKLSNKKLYVILEPQSDGSYLAKTDKYEGISLIIADGTDIDKEEDFLRNKSEDTKYWKALPIDGGNEYIGIKPTVKTDDGYYGTIYAGFAFKLASSGLKAYYVNSASGSQFNMKEVTDEVIAATMPVIIKCNSDNPADNKITPVSKGGQEPSDNMLYGVYCCLTNVSKHFCAKLFDPSSMRVMGVDNGKLAFVKNSDTLVDGKYLPANKAYLSVTGANDILTQDGTGIVTIKAEEKNSAAEGIYTLTGVRLPDGVTPKAGVYIKDGKKVVIK